MKIIRIDDNGDDDDDDDDDMCAYHGSSKNDWIYVMCSVYIDDIVWAKKT